MTSFRVSFFKNLSSSYGKPFKVCQRSMVIHSARSRARAIEAARAQFVRLERIDDWTLRADAVEAEVEPNETAGIPVPADLAPDISGHCRKVRPPSPRPPAG